MDSIQRTAKAKSVDQNPRATIVRVRDANDLHALVDFVAGAFRIVNSHDRYLVAILDQRPSQTLCKRSDTTMQAGRVLVTEIANVHLWVRCRWRPLGHRHRPCRRNERS